MALLLHRAVFCYLIMQLKYSLLGNFFDNLFKIFLGGNDVLCLLFTLDFTLDSDIAVIAESVKSLDYTVKINLALADGGFHAKLVAVYGIFTVLCVEVSYILAENIQSVHRVCLAVKNYVGGIQIYTKVVCARFLEAAEHCNGSFLTGFEEKPLAVGLQMVGNPLNCRTEGLEIGIVGVFVDKAHVGNHIYNTQLCRKIRTVAKVLHTHFTVLHGHKTQCFVAFIEVPHLRALPAAPECRDFYTVFRLIFLDKTGIFVGPGGGNPRKKLAVIEALLSQNLKLGGDFINVRKIHTYAYFHSEAPLISFNYKVIINDFSSYCNRRFLILINYDQKGAFLLKIGRICGMIWEYIFRKRSIFMKMRRFFSLLMLLCLVSSLILAGCNKEEDTKSQTSQTNADQEYIDLAGGRFYDDETITFLTNSTNTIYESEILNNVGTFYDEGADQTYPQIINDDLKLREEKVKDVLGITIEEIQFHAPQRQHGEMLSKVTMDNLASTEDYQIVVPCLYDGASLAVDDHLYNLLELDGLKIDAPWWNQEFNDSMTYADQLYFTIGDIGLVNKACTSALFFNFDVWKKYGLTEAYGGNPYELVRAGKWTVDVAFETAKLISNDRDGNNIINYKDEYGWSGQADDMWGIFFGAGERIASRDADGYPTITMVTERSTKVMDKLQDFVQGTGYYVSANDYFVLTDTPTDLTREAFISGRNLYFNDALGTVTTLGDMEQHFGVLPEPKFELKQEDYYSLVNPWGASCLAIPVCVTGEKLQMAVDVLNVMGAFSHKTLARDYQETVLSYMKTRDDDSADMINNYILPNRACDIGMVFAWGGLDRLLQDMADNPKGSFQSSVEGKLSSAEYAMQQTIDFYKSKE